MKKLFLSVAITVAFLTIAAKAETINCTEITTVPTIITAQGVYCLKRDKSSSLTSGKIIDIQANNVTIDLNGFKLGGLGAGDATQAIGISATNRQNITIRNGSIRGFFHGIDLVGGSSSSGHLVTDVLADTNREMGIQVVGRGSVVGNNRVINTGPGNASTMAIGILVSGNNTVVAHNIIADSAEDLAVGIFVTVATVAEVRNNTISDAQGGTRVGIELVSATDVTLIGNRIVNPTGSGSQGINALNSTGVNCINNLIAGFTTVSAGCNFDSGNITP